ncbi:Mini-ribonuclease 3 [Fusobacterium sp. PH5-44]|uniref:Mini-ribonuclease 3 n=1 Tax=unclassified Fusobacterium TaxID=2648384 RepID=UPI003D1F609B
MDNVGIIKKNVLINKKETSGLVMAYLGDAVWELVVREYFIKKGLNILNLNKKVTSFVNARVQSRIYKDIFPIVEEEYQDIGRRAKNANIKTFPKTCDKLEYREATGFEAIIGALYLDEKNYIIEKIIEKYAEEDRDGI